VYADTPPFLPSSQSVATLDNHDFELLTRAVELVVLSQACSVRGLGLALRIPTMSSAARIAGALEALGVVGPGGADDQRSVLIEPRDLPNLLSELRRSRG
jgi:DNA segregation ATPase FtsK/SpoIIIE-like protein